MVILYIFVILFAVALFIPLALTQHSIARFFTVMGLSFAGIILPLLSFWASMLLVPEWKGACEYGWADCFHSGKLCLTPLVLWACAAFYSIQIMRSDYRRWSVLGLFIGMIISGTCFVHGILVKTHEEAQWFYLIPTYTFIWYSILAVRVMRQSHLPLYAYLLALLGSIPFWIVSIISSIHKYQALPDTYPHDCFVVTAAARGHENFVGPFSPTEHRNKIRPANRQLSTFWQLEALWSRRFPNSHRRFRRIYNRVGPRIARRISTPWRADIIYLLLKPAELVAAVILQTNAERK